MRNSHEDRQRDHCPDHEDRGERADRQRYLGAMDQHPGFRHENQLRDGQAREHKAGHRRRDAARNQCRHELIQKTDDQPRCRRARLRYRH